jgi:hypothetical protein
MQPTGQDGAVGEFSGILRQRCECALGNVFRQVRIADHPQGSGIDQVSIAANQFGKCCLGPASGIITQELLVGQCAHLKKITRHHPNRTGKEFLAVFCQFQRWLERPCIIRSK